MKNLVLITITIIAILFFGVSAHSSCMMGKSHKSGHDMQNKHEMEKQEEEDILETEPIPQEEATEKIKSFIKNNLTKATAGDTELTECEMLGRTVYRASIKLADGTDGAVYLDAADGTPIAILLGDLEGKTTTTGETSQWPDPAKGKYVCPMQEHAYYSDKPGKCPICGMNLVETKSLYKKIHENGEKEKH